MYYLLSLFLIASLFSDEIPDAIPLGSFDIDPTSIAYGCVDIISGEYIDHEVDLVIPGPEPFVVERVFHYHKTLNGHTLAKKGLQWEFRHQGIVTMTKGYAKRAGHEAFNVQYYGPLGERHSLHHPNTKAFMAHGFELVQQSIHKGVTNLSKGVIGAQTNMTNARHVWDKPNDIYYLTEPNGTLQAFTKQFDNYYLSWEKLPSGLGRTFEFEPYLLKHKLINGNNDLLASLERRYCKDNGQRQQVFTSPDGRQAILKFDSIEYRFRDWQGGSDTIGFTGENGDVYTQEVPKPNSSHRYKYDLLKHVERTDKPRIDYAYWMGDDFYHKRSVPESDPGYHERDITIAYPKIACKAYPEGRALGILYYHFGTNDCAGTPINVNYASKSYLRTRDLYAPIGSDEKLLIKASFKYDEHCTTVFDAHRHKTEYHYNDDLRLSAIVKFDKDSKAQTIETLHWGVPNTPIAMNLQARTFGNANIAHKIFAKVHQYDHKGNIVIDELYGNLTGKSPTSLFVGPDGKPLSDTEHFRKAYMYSDDDYNLMILSHEGKIYKSYTYVPSSNLVQSVISIAEDHGTFQREFFEHDINSMVTEYIQDDGTGKTKDDLSGVTVRKKVSTTRSMTYPVGLALETAEHYLNLTTGHYQLFKKELNQYDGQGRLLKKETYGSDETLLATETWTYDAHSNITSYTNPLGEITTHTYDANDNMLTVQTANITKLYTYDFMNRLIKEEEVHSDGVFTKHYKYNLLGQKISTIDIYGNEINEEFDPFGRVITNIGVPIPNENNELVRPITRYEYDELGNHTKVTDTLGNVTQFKNTLYGKPYHILYPDGTEESFEYDLEGRLVKQVEKNGTYHLFHHDFLGRVIKKETYDKDNHLLSTIEAGYNTFHLLWEKDPEGNLTHYTYDSFGRKSSVSKGDLITSFTYDVFGRVTKQTLANSCKVTLYDVLNRVIEERLETLAGEILSWSKYSYDSQGNKISIEQEDSLTQITYDTHHNPVLTIDPEGNTTRLKVSYAAINSFGQKVLHIETTDALGQVTKILHDAAGKVVTKTVHNPYGQEIQHTDYLFNLMGKCVHTLDKLILPDNTSTETRRRSFLYDTFLRPITLIEAAGTPEEKRTSYTYNVIGQKETTTKPDGVTLKNTYDPLGRIIDFTSSDNSLHYHYTYNLNSQPIHIEDLLHHTKTLHTYDIHNRLISETLANELTVGMDYTPEGELAHLTLPDHSSVTYTYQGPTLREVTKYTPQNAPQYTHTYSQYNKRGLLTTSSPIHNLAPIDYQYTPRGAIKSITSPHLTGTFSYDARGNLIKKSLDDATSHYTYDNLYQLASEPSHTYTNDSLYNRRSKDNQSCSLNSLNQLLSHNDTTYTYDINGNLIHIQSPTQSHHFTYDALDRLITLQTPTHTIHYTYDESNRCVYKTTNGTQEKILYLYQNDIGTLTSDNTFKHLRILGRGLAAEIGSAIAIEIDSVPYAPIHDHLGNVLKLLNSSGTPVATYSYTAFGEETADTTLDNPYRFASKRNEHGYLLFGRRFYDPTTARWLTTDPLGYEAGPNLYAYVLNSPLTHFDAYGLRDESPSLWDHHQDARHNERMNSRRERSGNESGYNTSTRDSARSGSGGFLDTARNTLATCCDIASHLPIPVFNEIGRISSHFLRNGSLENYHSLYSIHATTIHIKGEIEDDYVRQIYFNGILTDEAGCIENGTFIAETTGRSVDAVFLPTRNFGLDIGVMFLNALGIMTESTYNAYETLKSSIDAVGPNGYVIAHVHSRGAESFILCMNKLTPEQKSHVIAVSYGGAAVINDSNLAYYNNYRHDGDIVPRVSPLCWGSKADDHIVRFNSPQEGIPHALIPTYGGVLKDEYNYLRKTYGF